MAFACFLFRFALSQGSLHPSLCRCHTTSVLI